MRRFSRLAAIAAGIAVAQLFSSAASAADYTWTNLAGGTTAWNVPSNWGGAGFPNAASDLGDINVGLLNNLTVTLPSNFTLGSLRLGSTAAPVTTTIGAVGGTNGLIFNNGTTGTTMFVRGVAGVTNVINAPIYLSGDNATYTTLAIGSTDNLTDPLANQRSLTINGNIQPIGNDRQITWNNRNGSTLTINGNMVLSGGIDTENLPTNGTGRRLSIAAAYGANVVINGNFQLGPLPRASQNNAGPIALGGPTGSPGGNVPLADIASPTFTLNADNTAFNGGVTLNRARFVLNAPNALGVGEIRFGNPSNEFGYDFVAGSDNYVMPNLIRWTQSLTLKGENSFVFNGVQYQSASRIFTNLLPAGETATFNNFIYAGNTETDVRNLHFDGTGLTLIEGGANGGLRNKIDFATTPTFTDESSVGGSLVKRGTGNLIVNATGSTLRGVIYAHGGLLEFATPGSYGVQTNNAGPGAMFVTPGGAVGVRTGSLDSDFLTRFTNDFPLLGNSTFNDSTGTQVRSRGAIALSTADAAANIDFSSGPLSNARLSGVSIGALSSGVTFTGTINPANNTYRLGGGGTLTMANANQLTGARNLEVANGGTVVLAQANNYTGTTTIQGNWLMTTQDYAAKGTDNIVQSYTDSSSNSIQERTTTGTYSSPVLEVKRLSDASSSLGSSASPIAIRGGVLRYSGSTNDSTTRNFAIGSAGATLDSSGTGTITFANTGAAVLEDQADLTSDVDLFTNALTASAGTINFGANDALKTANLGLGWTVTGPGISTSATIVSLSASTSNQSTAATILAYLRGNSGNTFTNAVGPQTYVFTNQSRTLTLTGSNTGNNVIANALGDSAKGTLAINKTGAGKWILSGNNSYTGATTVNAGTLGLGSANAVAGSSAVTVKSGATLSIDTPASTAVKLDNAKLTRESGSKLDLLRGKLVLDYSGTSPLASVKADIISGYAGGSFNGAGITTSDTVAGKKLRVGYAEASQLSGTTYFGQTLDGTAIVLAGTFAGDTDLNGNVNFDDLLKLAQNYNGTNKNWVDGDSDYNGTVDFDDLLGLAQSYSSSLASVDASVFGAEFASDWAMALAVVPEPVSLSGIAALGLLAGRRRRD